MAPTPLLATHVLLMQYAIGGFTHGTSPFVKAQVGTGPTGYDLVSTTGGGVDTQTVVDDFAADFGPIAATGSTAAGWTLYQIVSGALVPIAVGAWTFTPSILSVYAGKQWTWIGRDSDLRIVKFELLETASGDFQHYSSVSGIPAGVTKTFTEAWLNPAPENWGSFFRGRNDKMVNVFRGLTCGPNRKWRRKRGLA